MALGLRNFPEASSRWLQKLQDMMHGQRQEFREREKSWYAKKAEMEDKLRTFNFKNIQVCGVCVVCVCVCYMGYCNARVVSWGLYPLLLS